MSSVIASAFGLLGSLPGSRGRFPPVSSTGDRPACRRGLLRGHGRRRERRRKARRRGRDRGCSDLVREPKLGKQDIVRGATARDNVCIQPHDIDGDGRIDFALGAGWRPTDTKGPSTLQWLGRDRQGRWQIHPIAFEEPTLHRLRFGRRERHGPEAARGRCVAGARDQGTELGARAGGAHPRS